MVGASAKASSRLSTDGIHSKVVHKETVSWLFPKATPTFPLCCKRGSTSGCDTDIGAILPDPIVSAPSVSDSRDEEARSELVKGNGKMMMCEGGRTARTGAFARSPIARR